MTNTEVNLGSVFYRGNLVNGNWIGLYIVNQFNASIVATGNFIIYLAKKACHFHVDVSNVCNRVSDNDLFNAVIFTA